ncbi:winged helix-turn-helix domain-containing protein [Methanolobus sp. ZRKC2]|uniref:helix-turn-helix transcriptional regulator n=1 Tax=Methanolobus sp. ZRKC2 TaxID=3125783 RepID=UPI0032483E87
MKRTLSDVLFASEKRKNVLLLLREEPRMMDDLLKSLETTRQALLPQIRILEDNYLVSSFMDVYELTTVGKVVVDKMAPLLKTFELFDGDINYWRTHNLDFIPTHLLPGISEFRKSTVVDLPLVDQYDIQKIYSEKSKESESVYAVTELLYPNYQIVFSELIDNGVNIYLIVSKSLLEKIRTYYREDFEKYMESKFFNIFVYNKKMDFVFFTFDDYQVLMSLLKNNGEFDSTHVVCSDPKALDWIKDLFDYYLQDSIPLNEI